MATKAGDDYAYIRAHMDPEVFLAPLKGEAPIKHPNSLPVPSDEDVKVLVAWIKEQHAAVLAMIGNPFFYGFNSTVDPLTNTNWFVDMLKWAEEHSPPEGSQP